ncbi:MAG TPA: fibronectin type III domain-containing protein [Candidatus Angelobacter sp.]|nr:fibronectin type III domain-containing protein [Candidatus Angelobacter sp.]
MRTISAGKKALAPLIAVFLLNVFILTPGMANAQSTSTNLFGTGLTAPTGAQVLSGTAINPTTGQPVRHLWVTDGVQGLCRMDPDIDTPGTHSINPDTCLVSQVRPSVLTFDPVNSLLYTADTGKLGLVSLHYLPAGDNGQGSIDQLGITAVAVNCGIFGNQPDSLALGPDSNMYIGFRKNGNIVRVTGPTQQTIACSDVQNVANIPDNKRNQALGFIGHTLFGVDTISAYEIPDADQCKIANNGCLGTSVLPVTAGASLMLSDQDGQSLNGNNLFFSDGTTVTQVANVAAGLTNAQTTTNYGGTGFSFISALAVDTVDPINPVLFVADDPSNGLTTGNGRLFQVVVTPAQVAPSTPTNVQATAGDSQATVRWTELSGGGAVNSYTVHNSFASNGTIVPDVIVAPPAGSTVPPTSALITGLTNGVAYQFEVSAANDIGVSPFSSSSDSVTPHAITVPGAPTAVTATAGNAQAGVSWTAPADDGGSPITSYTVTALVGGVVTGTPVTVAAPTTSAVVSGLTNGTTYTFTVHATNGIGSGAESAPSNGVTPSVSTGLPDLSLSINGATSVPPGSNVIYTLSVTNTGAGPAPDVVLSDTLPASGATLVSVSTSQGVCTSSGALINCNLGALDVGVVAKVAITLNVTAQISDSASVQAFDANGTALTDPTPANNSASITTGIAAPTTTTDVQTIGSAANGGPAVNTADFINWQVKNNQSTEANNVVFTATLPSGVLYSSVSGSLGVTCTAPAPGTAGGTVTCNLASLAGSQTMLVTLNFTVVTAGSLPFTGSASFNGTDTNPANNSATVVINAK